MKKNIPLLLASAVVIALFIFLQILVVIRQGEVGVLTSLGKPVKEFTEPGRYLRWPAPIQRVYRFDNRMRTLESSFEESLTKDGKNIMVGLYTGWRVVQPTTFLERVGFSDEQARTNLDALVRAQKSAAIGQYPFSNFVNTDASQVRLEDIERQILDAVKPAALERYGIEVVVVGIHRIGLPEAITASVFERMKAERKQLAERYRSEGEGESTKIRARADSEREQVLAKARGEAEKIRAEGDAEAVQFYKIFEQNRDLAVFLRKLKSAEKILENNATLVLPTHMAPLDVLENLGLDVPKKKSGETQPEEFDLRP